MPTLNKLIENVWFFTGHLSKKAYTAGLIVFAGVAAVAVMFIGVNGYANSSSVTHITTYEVDEVDDSEVAEIELVTDEVVSEESSFNYVEWTLTSCEAQQAALAAEPEVTLVQETNITKNFKISGNIGNAESALLSVKDYTALIRIVEAEATSEDLKGKILIANVVLNRVEVNGFPNSIYDVVNQKLNGRAQFSPIDDGRYYTVPITSSTEQAVEEALRGTDYSNGALFFVAKSLASEKAGSWFDRDLEFVMKHGVHSFYKYYD